MEKEKKFGLIISEATMINKERFELLAFGRLAIAKPNLLEFIKNNQESNREIIGMSSH
jgi:2,4-dienoyl-CoA reductase-like NADH-dependent reductase (Old Yellow Enzyme family)